MITHKHMSKKQYHKALNDEIEKLNGIIDFKILHGADFKREARRHKRLLSQIRREEVRRSALRLPYLWKPSWF